MDTSNIASLLAKLGTEAVLRYRQISGASSDSAIPEVFLGSFIACRMHDHLNRPVHIEHPYDKMARELGITDSKLIGEMKSQRADLVIYREEVPAPSHVVEFKI